MRVLQKETSENRKRKLLQAVIYHYVRTAKPVGSQVIVDKYNFGLSSAEKHMLFHTTHARRWQFPFTHFSPHPSSSKKLTFSKNFAQGHGPPVPINAKLEFTVHKRIHPN